MRRNTIALAVNRLALPALLAGAAIALAPTLQAQDWDDWEWEPGEGYHRQEWYDPSDWFDARDGVDYEYDDWDFQPFGYDDGFYDTRIGRPPYDHPQYTPPYQGRQLDTYGEGYDQDLGFDYEWDDQSRTWVQGGQDERRFGQDTMRRRSGDLEFGVHYRWDAARQDWVRAVGYYDPAYAFTYHPGRPYDEDANVGRRQDPFEREFGQQGRQQDFGQQQELSGTLESFSRVNLQSGQPDHSFVRLRLADGRSAIVDLGPDASPSELGLERDAQVRVRGTARRVGGEEVLAATAVTVDGRTRLQREDRFMGSGMGETVSQQTGSRIEGSVQGFKRERVQGEEHMFVQLQTSQGERRVIELGPTDQLGSFRLEQGQRIRVEGTPTYFQGQQILVVHRLQTQEGQTSSRSPQSARQPFQGGQDSGFSTRYPMSGSQGMRSSGSGGDRFDGFALVVLDVAPARSALKSDQYSSRKEPNKLIVCGTVEDVRSADLQNRPSEMQDHNVACIKMSDGDEKLVDLGPRIRASSLGLNKGDQVWIHGERKSVGGEEVVVAETIHVASGTGSSGQQSGSSSQGN